MCVYVGREEEGGWLWIKYDNRARGDGSVRKGGSRGLIPGVGEGGRRRGRAFL